MKILGISASPRHQATEFAVKKALSKAETYPGIVTEFISFRGKKINPCIHCDYCIKKKTNCFRKDDMNELLEKFVQADGYIIGSPVYSYNPVPELIMFFNRMRPWRVAFPHESMEGKVGGAIAVGGTRNGGQELTINSIINLYLSREIMVVGGSTGNYTGGKVWTNNKDSAGAEEDEIGIVSSEDIGARVAKALLLIKGERK
ncbi:MAG TPA: flavodoxin family protein [Clostridia bacterium]|nr:flavodoxin family protein [Clostridia bacterium]